MRVKASLMGAVVGLGLVLTATAVTPAAARTVLPPSITARPDSVMVNTRTVLVGRNFDPHVSLRIAECSATKWVVPTSPCDTNNVVKVTTDAKGTFVTTMKVEACPEVVTKASKGLSELCYIGVPRPSGIDTVSLVPRTSVVVTFP